MSCSRRWSVRLLVIALVVAVAAGSLMDTRRYVDRHPAAATKPHDDLLMVPLSIGVVTTLDSVELCLHRGDRLGVTQYRLVGAQQLVRPSVRPTLTEPVVVRAVAGERIITAADSLPVAEWRAPAAWEAPAATAYPPRMLPVPQYAVLLACSLGEDYVLDISIRNFTQLIEAVKDDESEWHTVFHGSVASVFTHDTITAQLERAEEKLGMDSERRADAKSRQAFERLVISLLASVGEGGENDQTHHHDDEHEGSDVNISASSAAMVRRVGEESLRMLLDTVGTVQVPHFWEGVERALRKKVPFDDENDDESTAS